MDLSDILNSEKEFRYRLLSRMKSDCQYYLGYGGRHPKNLWAGNEADHISYMKEIWKSFPEKEKPEWLSFEDILAFEQAMIPRTQTQALSQLIQSAEADKVRAKEAIFRQCLIEALEENDLTSENGLSLEMATEVVKQMGNGMLFEPLASQYRECVLKDHPEWESYTDFDLASILYQDFCRRLDLYEYTKVTPEKDFSILD